MVVLSMQISGFLSFCNALLQSCVRNIFVMRFGIESLGMKQHPVETSTSQILWVILLDKRSSYRYMRTMINHHLCSVWTWQLAAQYKTGKLNSKENAPWLLWLGTWEQWRKKPFQSVCKLRTFDSVFHTGPTAANNHTMTPLLKCSSMDLLTQRCTVARAQTKCLAMEAFRMHMNRDFDVWATRALGLSSCTVALSFHVCFLFCQRNCPNGLLPLLQNGWEKSCKKCKQLWYLMLPGSWNEFVDGAWKARQWASSTNKIMPAAQFTFKSPILQLGM